MTKASRQISKSVVAFLLLFILIANFLSKSLVEHSVIPLLLCLFYLVAKGINEFSWKKVFPSSGFDWLFVVWIMILLAGHILNGTLGSHEVTEICEYRWLLAVYFMAAAMLFTSVSHRGVKLFVCAIGVVCAFYVGHFYMTRADKSVFGMPNRMTGFLESPTDFGHSVQFLFIFSVVLLAIRFKDKDTWFKIALSCAALFSGINLFLSFTRISIIAVVVSLLAFFIVNNRKLMWKVLTGFVVFAVSAFVGNIGGFRDRILFTLHPEKTYDENRLLLWKYNWALFMDHPWLGVGYHRNFVKYHQAHNTFGIPERYFEAHAHNQILNLLGGVGILGAAWYIVIMAMFGVLATRNIRKFQKQSLQYAIAVSTLVMLGAFVIAGFADTNFELVAPHYYLGFTWAVIIYQKYTDQDILVEQR